jgi:hypothetical protein
LAGRKNGRAFNALSVWWLRMQTQRCLFRLIFTTAAPAGQALFRIEAA